MLNQAVTPGWARLSYSQQSPLLAQLAKNRLGGGKVGLDPDVVRGIARQIAAGQRAGPERAAVDRHPFPHPDQPVPSAATGQHHRDAAAQQQLAGLTASQKMLTVALVAVMVMTGAAEKFFKIAQGELPPLTQEQATDVLSQLNLLPAQTTDTDLGAADSIATMSSPHSFLGLPLICRFSKIA